MNFRDIDGCVGTGDYRRAIALIAGQLPSLIERLVGEAFEAGRLDAFSAVELPAGADLSAVRLSEHVKVQASRLVIRESEPGFDVFALLEMLQTAAAHLESTNTGGAR